MDDTRPSLESQSYGRGAAHAHVESSEDDDDDEEPEEDEDEPYEDAFQDVTVPSSRRARRALSMFSMIFW